MKRSFYTLLAAVVLVPGLTFAHQSFAQGTPPSSPPAVTAPGTGGSSAGTTNTEKRKDFKGKHERMERRKDHREMKRMDKRREERRHDRRKERREGHRRHERHEMKK